VAAAVWSGTPATSSVLACCIVPGTCRYAAGLSVSAIRAALLQYFKISTTGTSYLWNPYRAFGLDLIGVLVIRWHGSKCTRLAVLCQGLCVVPDYSVAQPA
jgi:hypothetical protein